ncbi:hypothetical protein THAOC_07934 [Thalassiosira oceanica]|uniref:Uncharacterized protein n=1 Tax=Thalassiosira oceanica TaxID=159749 RepID=K0TBB4_THAOC|nr:hypothetical protein THAOC_07934 [Thalassiosira oceanica]|eukprot:EJK70686.1 hypothetical protein THAOC_07934 [Thalassiosira oceanica]
MRKSRIGGCASRGRPDAEEQEGRFATLRPLGRYTVDCETPVRLLLWSLSALHFPPSTHLHIVHPMAAAGETPPPEGRRTREPSGSSAGGDIGDWMRRLRLFPPAYGWDGSHAGAGGGSPPGGGRRGRRERVAAPGRRVLERGLQDAPKQQPAA